MQTTRTAVVLLIRRFLFFPIVQFENSAKVRARNRCHTALCAPNFFNLKALRVQSPFANIIIGFYAQYYRKSPQSGLIEINESTMYTKRSYNAANSLASLARTPEIGQGLARILSCGARKLEQT